MGWYSVRCLFVLEPDLYEERITLWQADDADHAIERAEAEAGRYGETVRGEYLGLAQAYRLGEDPGDAVAVFSLLRESRLDAGGYVTRFFDTGSEQPPRSS
jgi:hypothetical protein